VVASANSSVKSVSAFVYQVYLIISPVNEKHAKHERKRAMQLRPRRNPGASQLASLTVSWKPFKNTANEVSFHIVTTAKLTQPSNQELKIIQYIQDGLSIAGGTNPGNLVYCMTEFKEDENESGQNDQSEASYDDKPGYDKKHGLQADTNLKYVFGAYWKVMLGDTLLTETTTLFGSVTGAYGGGGRTFTPNGEVVAAWDATNEVWRNVGSLSEDFPGWAPYPEPKIRDNK
jgi:hypothetical protein